MDRLTQELLLGHLNGAFPQDSYCAEEDTSRLARVRAEARNPERTWIVDPIDGTRGFAMKNGEFSVMVTLVERDPRFYAEIDRASGFQTRSLLCVPLRRAGKVVGVLEVANRFDEAPFSDADRQRLEGLAAESGGGCDPDLLCRDPQAMRALLARAVTLVPSEAASLLLVDPAGRVDE